MRPSGRFGHSSDGVGVTTAIGEPPTEVALVLTGTARHDLSVSAEPVDYIVTGVSETVNTPVEELLHFFLLT